jgi:5-methylcytosine-specific restriction endonuclease McrA
MNKRERTPFNLNAWREDNRERLNARARQNAKKYRRRHRINDILRRSAAPEKISTNFATNLIKKAKGLCIYCGLPTSDLVLDHIEPVVHGGAAEKDNFMPCCRQCNWSKGSKDVADWLFAKHGVLGLARAVLFMEQRRIVSELMTDLLNERQATCEAVPYLGPAV